MASKDKTKRKRRQDNVEDKLFESDETFAFIAGYTSGGAPYGITWEEMETIERREVELFEKVGHGYNDKELELPFD